MRRLTSESSVGQMMELFTCSTQLSRFAPRVFEVLALLNITDARPLLDASANNDDWKSLTDAMFVVEGENVVDVYAQSSMKALAFHARSAELASKSVEATHSSAVAFPPAVVGSARLSSGPTMSEVPTADFLRPAPRQSLQPDQPLALTTSETPTPTAPLLLASPVVQPALSTTTPPKGRFGPAGPNAHPGFGLVRICWWEAKGSIEATRSCQNNCYSPKPRWTPGCISFD